ncbi:hypothetical protein HAX54_020198 [Datura stramonium]|uniref:Uncharacterized protein n=1 Tax=Datura stramonium TaxID=4076 RepID=A0ABS8USM1_DATST|nr:hypothetical protein [Datura stramonium]
MDLFLGEQPTEATAPTTLPLAAYPVGKHPHEDTGRHKSLKDLEDLMTSSTLERSQMDTSKVRTNVSTPNLQGVVEIEGTAPHMTTPLPATQLPDLEQTIDPAPT